MWEFRQKMLKSLDKPKKRLPLLEWCYIKGPDSIKL